MSHGVSLGLLVKRDGGKLPSFLASVLLEVIVLFGDFGILSPSKLGLGLK
jgi:hypothetical protein